MIKHKIFTFAKIKILVITLLFTEFVLVPFDNRVNAQELYTYLKPQEEKVNIMALNQSLNNVPSPDQLENERKAALEAQRKAEEEARAKLIAEQENSRASALDNFLSAKGSPLAGHGVTLARLEKQYGVSANLVIGISGVESQFCKINFKPYNCWGWMGHAFSNYDDALTGYFGYVSSFYFSKGMTTPAAMQRVYCPGSTTWAGNVTRYMNQVP